MASPHSASSSPASALGTGDNHAMMPEGGTETRPLPPVSSFVRITLVGSAILGVVALLPYGLLRARISRIERSMDHIAAVSAATERDLQKLLELNAVRRGEHKQLSGLVAETKNSMEEMRRAGERRENEQRATNEREQVGSGAPIVRIRDIATYTSNCRTHASALKDVGRSLADIAAFMHEVEVRQGYVPSPDDKRGIERARQLAKKLQELSNT
ncbi:hypothetical protein FOMPIDRAFT_1154353, partial [Fomitopsis schrenkii]